MTFRSLLRKLLPLVATATFAPAAMSAPCAGFDDVENPSDFCPNVEWIRNRAVTLGCSPGLYCPGESVTRLQMAAFMNRLGTALTPIVVRADATPGALDLDTSPVVCQSDPQTIMSFPRRALADATISGSAASGVNIATHVVYSTDGGANWQPFSSARAVGFVQAGGWGAVSDLGALDLDVGTSVRFGIRVARQGAGSVNLSGSRCQLRVAIGSRNGGASPY